MKRIMNLVSEYIANVPDQVRKRKLLVLLFFIVATITFFIGMQRTKFDFTIEGWFKQDDPTFVGFNELHAQFGSEDGVMIVYKPKDGDVFSAESLEAVKGIRQELLTYRSKLKDGEKSPLDHIVKIDTLINASVLTVKGDMLLSRPLVGETVPISREVLEKIRKTAEAQNGFPLRYFSRDMKYGGIYIETDFGAIPVDSDKQSVKDMTMDDMKFEGNDKTTKETPRFKPTNTADYFDLNTALKVILNKSEYANHLEYYAVGNTAESEYQSEIGKEMGLLYLAAIFIMIILLWFFFRSFSGVVWSLLIVILSTIWTIGSAGLLGLPVTPFIILTVLLLLTVGIADAVHIMSGYMFFRKANHDHGSALRTVYGNAGTALLLTGITNMVGIIALNIADLVPIKNFAIMTSLGVFWALFLTIYLLPVLLELWSPVVKVEQAPKKKLSVIDRIIPNFSLFLQKAFDKVVPAVEKGPMIYIVAFVVVFGICIAGSFKVKVDSSITDKYAADSKFNQGVRIIDQKMAGSNRIALYLDLGKEKALQDPRVLNVIDDLQHKFEKKYSKYVVTTSSIVDIVKDVYQKLNEGRQDKYIIPSNEKELSQTLFLFNNANPEERRRLVDDNYQKANVTITLHEYGSYEYNAVFNQMQKDIYESLDTIKKKYPEARVSITGMFALAMKTVEYLITNELQGFTTALFVISLILLVVFGSFKAGLIALIPNLIPSFLTFGLLGLFNIPLDFYTMMLAPIIIGVSVDDTVHFITMYRLEVSTDGDIKKALKHTMKETGQAIVFTSMILGLGFGIMSVASSPGMSNMGKFGILAVFSGLLNDLFLLPALIMVFKLRSQNKEVKQEQLNVVPNV